MNKKFQNKYRIPSNRLKNWDYRKNGAYFITICTGNREHFFGEIVSENENKIQLNEIGKLANEFWAKIPEHFPFIELGNFVVMPNHVHGILIMNKTNVDVETLQCNVLLNNGTTLQSNDGMTFDPIENQHSVETLRKTLPGNVSTAGNGMRNEQMAKISPKQGSISAILRSYKSVVTKHARYIHADFSWQERFHDHIIQNSESFERIQNYIENNITNWKEDKFYN